MKPRIPELLLKARNAMSIARQYPTADGTDQMLLDVIQEIDNSPAAANTEGAAQSQEPVAWMWQHGETGNIGFVENASKEDLERWEHINKPRQIICPLYTHPPADRPKINDDTIDSVTKG